MNNSINRQKHQELSMAVEQFIKNGGCIVREKVSFDKLKESFKKQISKNAHPVKRKWNTEK